MLIKRGKTFSLAVKFLSLTSFSGEVISFRPVGSLRSSGRSGGLSMQCFKSTQFMNKLIIRLTKKISSEAVLGYLRKKNYRKEVTMLFRLHPQDLQHFHVFSLVSAVPHLV